MRTANLWWMTALFTALITTSLDADVEPMYWVDAHGNFVRDSYGECIRTSAWQSGQYTPGCDPEPPRAEVEEEETVVEVAKFEQPLPPPEPIVEKLILESTELFASNSSELTPEGMTAIADLATQLQQFDSVQAIEVAGYTDDTGPADYNQALSERRAEAVKAQLVELGVDASVITTRGYGQSNPVASNATREGRAKNRRAEVTITAEKEVLQ